MKLNKRIITVMVTVLALFLVLVGYLTYFTVFRAPEIIKSNHNPRIWEREKKILRGTIYDRAGVVLAESKKDGDNQERVYPYGSIYAHTIGYNNRNYGKTNIESQFNDYLMKTPSVIDVLRKDTAEDEGEEDPLTKGANLSLTLDHSMTQLAAQLMGNDHGSVVALNPVTGEVYCLYSSPTFDPNEAKLTENWDELTERSDSPFFPRATQGLYAPGSTFKVVTAAAGIDEGHENFTFNDKGKTTVGGKPFRNAGGKAYGQIDMSDAIRVSSNVFFTQLSQVIGKDALREKAKDFCVMKKVPFDIPTNAADGVFDDIDNAELGSVAIGQGKLRVSPFNMALVASAIANDGVIMRPYMVEEAFFEDGESVYNATPEALSRATSSRAAAMIKEYMVGCVRGGTGTAAKVPGIDVAGKTGTAENERKGKTHAWFIGFAPADNPQLAICVMKEYSGHGGGSVCAPIAAKLIQNALNSGLITR
ncbi:MAG: peptidoglycan glycosyltransferase [Clostridia bacterium]|nr:peptidoglycan glycosyltransferase [Clostridia bacterium]